MPYSGDGSTLDVAMGASPLMVIPEQGDSVCITVDCKRFNFHRPRGPTPAPLGWHFGLVAQGRSLFHPWSQLKRFTTSLPTLTLAVVPMDFRTPTQLFELRVCHGGPSALPSWFVEVADKVVHGPRRALAYLDDVVCFDAYPVCDDTSMVEFFQHPRQYNLKTFSPGKPRTGGTHAM